MKGREIFIELDYKYKVSAQHNTVGPDSFIPAKKSSGFNCLLSKAGDTK